MPITSDKNGTPIKVTGTTTADTEIIPTNQLIYIKYIYWFNPTAAGHLCTLTDGQGRNLIEMRAFCAGDNQVWPIGIKINGLRCNDMDSGTLYIYHP